MKLKELFEDNKFKENENGSLTWGWKDRNELCDEEDNKRYIPIGFNKILVLGGIYANEPGKGQGDLLMKDFLNTEEAKSADLIYLDPVPGLGKNYGSDKTENAQVSSLVKFYKKYGFRHNPKSATRRMWLVQKGTIQDDKLPE